MSKTLINLFWGHNRPREWVQLKEKASGQKAVRKNTQCDATQKEGQNMNIEHYSDGDVKGSESIQAEDQQAHIKKMTLQIVKEGRNLGSSRQNKVIRFMSP